MVPHLHLLREFSCEIPENYISKYYYNHILFSPFKFQLGQGGNLFRHLYYYESDKPNWMSILLCFHLMVTENVVINWQSKRAAFRTHVQDQHLKIIVAQYSPKNWLRGMVLEKNYFKNVYPIYSSRYTKEGAMIGLNQN